MKSKNKLKYYEIHNDLWKAPLSLYIGNKESYNKRMKKLGLEDDVLVLNEAGKYWMDREKGYKVMWIPSLENKDVLIHELVHYCFDVMNTKGVPIQYENDETIAYLMEYMFNKIMSYEK